jgi:hypothetical protein
MITFVIMKDLSLPHDGQISRAVRSTHEGDSDNNRGQCVWLVNVFPLSNGALPGVGAMTWSPLACGLITGKYSEGVPDCSRAAMKVRDPVSGS